MQKNHEFTYHQIVLDKIKVANRHLIGFRPLTESDIEVRIEDAMGGLAIGLRTYMLGADKQKIEWSVSYPKTWWDHLKRDVLPSWITDRMKSVEYETQKFYEDKYGKVCPHLQSDDPGDHVTFMALETSPLPVFAEDYPTEQA